MADEAKLLIILEAQSNKLQRQLVTVSKQIDRMASQTERRFEQMQKKSSASFDQLAKKLDASAGRIRKSLGVADGVLAPVVGAIGIREVIRYADAWTEAGNKIAAAAQVSGQMPRSLDQLKDSANGARQELSDYVDLYARLLRVSPNVAASEADVARATDIVAKSLKAGSSSAQEQAAALIQLGQAIGSGFLQGDELRSLRENAPLLAKAIAEEFGVTIGELKELGAQGKITSDRVFKAILAGGADIEAAFDATQSTIHDAFTRIGNEFTAYIGTAGEASGATQGLIDALNWLAQNFTDVADVVLQFATLLAGALAGKAIAGVVVGIGEAVAAVGVFITALRAGTLAAGAFTAALGPIGLLAGAAAAAIFLMNQAQEEGKRAAEQHTKLINGNAEALALAGEASNNYRQSLRDQIAMQVKAAEAALTEADAQTKAARAKAASMRFELFGKTYGNSFLEADADGKLATSLALDKALQQLEAQLAEADALLGKGSNSTGLSTGGAGDQEKFSKALETMRQRTADLQAETAAQAKLNPLVNDYGFALERARAQQDLLNAAKEAGLTITPELKASIDQLAIGYAQASAEAARLAESQDKVRESAQFMRDTLKDATSSFIQDLLDGRSAAEALSNALVDVGNRLIGLGLDTLFGKGDSFGLFGQLFGFAKGGVAAHGRPKMFANGGVSNTAAVFGEAGPEAAVPLPDGRRIPVDLRMPKSASGGGVTVTFAPVIDATGADSAAIARLEQGLAKMKAELPATVVGAVRRARKTGNL